MVKNKKEQEFQLIHESVQLCHRGVVYNSKLKRRYYGRISSNGFCFRNGRCCGARSFGEINKNTKRKRNFGSGLQGRINDCCKTLCNGGVIQHGVVLEFTVETQSNNLTYRKPYTKKQQLIYRLIKFMHDEGLGYRRIAIKLNIFGIKTVRNTIWNNAKVYSVLKREHQRRVRVDSIRKKKYPIYISSLAFRGN